MDDEHLLCSPAEWTVCLNVHHQLSSANMTNTLAYPELTNGQSRSTVQAAPMVGVSLPARQADPLRACRCRHI